MHDCEVSLYEDAFEHFGGLPVLTMLIQLPSDLSRPNPNPNREPRRDLIFEHTVHRPWRLKCIVSAGW